TAASGAASWILQKCGGADPARYASGFRAFPTALRENFAGNYGPGVCLDALLSRGAPRFTGVPVRFDAGARRRSNYTLPMLAGRALEMAAGFSVLPFRMAGAAGCLLVFFGAGAGVCIAARLLAGGGFAVGLALFSPVAFLFGGSLLVLWTIGERHARMYSRAPGMPPAAVRETAGFRGAGPDDGASGE
ncbi:MAG: hypothetical protein AB1742_11890, partial [bacterium]